MGAERQIGQVEEVKKPEASPEIFVREAAIRVRREASVVRGIGMSSAEVRAEIARVEESVGF